MAVAVIIPYKTARFFMYFCKSDIIRMIDDTQELVWQKELSERGYLKLTSSEALMKKAKEMKLSVTTSDKFVKLD